MARERLVHAADHDSHTPRTYYFACPTCGNCSKHYENKLLVAIAAADHMEDHAARTT